MRDVGSDYVKLFNKIMTLPHKTAQCYYLSILSFRSVFPFCLSVLSKKNLRQSAQCCNAAAADVLLMTRSTAFVAADMLTYIPHGGGVTRNDRSDRRRQE